MIKISRKGLIGVVGNPIKIGALIKTPSGSEIMAPIFSRSFSPIKSNKHVVIDFNF